MKESQIDYEKVITAVEKTISGTSFYLQSLSVFICFALAYFAYGTCKRFILTNFSKEAGGKYTDIVFRYGIPMLYPSLAALIQIAGISIYEQFFKETIIFSATLKLTSLLLLLRFVRISSGNTITANVMGAFLVPSLILDLFGALDPVIEFLDQFALKVGDVKISIYLAIKAFIVLLSVFWLLGFISRKSKSYFDSSKNIKLSTKNIISKVIDILVYLVIIIVILKIFGVDLTTLAVLGGAIGVGIGFGLQKIASNFISGIILLLEKSIEIGDIVEIDNGTIFGTIKHFSGRYTLIESQDGKEVMVPNEDLIIHKVTNWTHSNTYARVEVSFSVSYGSNLELVRDIALSCASSHPRCLQSPAMECFVTDFGESGIKFILFFWISNIADGRFGPKSEVMMKIYREFNERGIEIPLPKREFVVSKAGWKKEKVLF